ncbi:MAG: hypothetical protein ACOYK6_02755 [Chthoniobacterales bacterium]
MSCSTSFSDFNPTSNENSAAANSNLNWTDKGWIAWLGRLSCFFKFRSFPSNDSIYATHTQTEPSSAPPLKVKSSFFSKGYLFYPSASTVDKSLIRAQNAQWAASKAPQNTHLQAKAIQDLQQAQEDVVKFLTPRIPLGWWPFETKNLQTLQAKIDTLLKKTNSNGPLDALIKDTNTQRDGAVLFDPVNNKTTIESVVKSYIKKTSEDIKDLNLDDILEMDDTASSHILRLDADKRGSTRALIIVKKLSTSHKGEKTGLLPYELLNCFVKNMEQILQALLKRNYVPNLDFLVFLTSLLTILNFFWSLVRS